ncbi:hypothetical protein D3C87_1565760 [compost metagenome]
MADGATGGDDLLALEIAGVVQRRILGREDRGGVASLGMHDADHLDRCTGAEGEHVGRIPQGADVHGTGIQCFAQWGGGREFGELDVVGQILQLAGDFQQYLDRGLLIGHQQRLKVGGVAECGAAQGAEQAQQQGFY